MKKFNVKRIAAVTMAAMMAVSAECVNVFAAEDSDPVIAAVTGGGEVIAEVRQSDLSGGEYSVICDCGTITIGENENGIAPMSANSESFISGRPGTSKTKTVNSTSSYSYSFSVTKGNTRYTPYRFISGEGTVVYKITGNANYGSSAVATVYWDISGAEPMEIELYSGDHYARLNGSAGSTSYASVYNESYSSTVTGTCVISAN